jgi:ribosomal protein S18 acetylase RimI-like enzyme
MTHVRTTGPAGVSWTVRRLRASDAVVYQQLRLEGFERHPREFRIAPQDEQGLLRETVAGRLEGSFVAGAYGGDELVGIAGFTRFEGAKLRHRALLWGMYVSPAARGGRVGDALIDFLLTEARTEGIEQMILTVAAENERARRLYQRWGFSAYGTEPRAIKLPDGYLDELLMHSRLV